MSITAWDIKEAAFAADTKDVEELILANKGATDVGALSQATNLRSLSLAFNSLSGLSGLAPLTRLQSLNVSHNQLVSLKGLQGLSCLVSLNASHNKVVSLAPLSGLSALADLWLQNNAVAAPAELRVLEGLPALQRLAIANNPVAKALPPEHVRLVALRLCPALRLMDGRPVEAAEQEASGVVNPDVFLAAARPAAPGSAPAATNVPSSPAFLGTQAGLDDRTPTHSSGSDRGQRRGGGRGRPTGRRPSNGASGALVPDSQLAAAAARRPARSSSYDAMPDTYSPTLISLHRARGLSGGAGQSGSAGNGIDGEESASPLPLEPSASFSSATSGVSSRSGAPRGAASRRPPLSGAVRPAAQLEGSQFQAVLDALPKFDSSKLPARYSGAPPRPRGAAGAAPAAPAARPPPDAHVVEYEAKYPVQRGGGRAVVVRRDGSAAAFWPGGDMAVTIDADYSSAAPADAQVDGDGDSNKALGPRCSYKMMAMYRAGGVAVSWDAQGGFVQYPSGGLMLMYSRVTGSGTCYSPTSDITRRWRDPDATAVAPPTPAIELPFPLAKPHTPPAPPPPPPSHIDMQLDPHLGVRFIGASHSLELYLCCEGVRYRLRCGRNTPGEVWEPPPGRGDSGGNGGCLSVLTIESRNSAAGTPSEGSRPVRSPAGEASGAGEVGSSVAEGGLPPPAFLRNLARQGGAGTHKPTGAAAKQQQGSGGAASAAARPGADAEEGGGIASITAGLEALTEGLQALLARSTRDTAVVAEGEENRTSSLAGPSPAAKPSPGKMRRGPGAGSGVSAVRALASEAEAADEAAVVADAVTRGSAARASSTGRDASAGAASRPSSSSSDECGQVHRRGAQAGERRGSSGQGSGHGTVVGRQGSTQRGPGPPPEANKGASLPPNGAMGAKQATSVSVTPLLAAAAASGAHEGDGSGPDSADGLAGGGKAGDERRPTLDSDVAAQLAAARKLAADSLAAAMAAASAAAAVGSQPD